MTIQRMTLDELIDHLLDLRDGKPANKETMIDIIIEQLLQQREIEAKVDSIADEFFDGV